MSTEGNRFEPAAAQNMLALFQFHDWKRIRDLLGVLQKDMKSALRSAVRRTGNWANKEGAKGIAQATGISLDILRAGLRIKFQYQSVKGFSTARLWYGLNPISLKYLTDSEKELYYNALFAEGNPGFVAKKIGGHAFQRVGKGRLPIKRIERPIAQKGFSFIQEFEAKVAEKFVIFFFQALDRLTGREKGESESIVGGTNVTIKYK
jgi:hypothetical protein